MRMVFPLEAGEGKKKMGLKVIGLGESSYLIGYGVEGLKCGKGEWEGVGVRECLLGCSPLLWSGCL